MYNKLFFMLYKIIKKTKNEKVLLYISYYPEQLINSQRLIIHRAIKRCEKNETCKIKIIENNRNFFVNEKYIKN